jgi:hypothetical protein
MQVQPETSHGQDMLCLWMSIHLVPLQGVVNYHMMAWIGGQDLICDTFAGHSFFDFQRPHTLYRISDQVLTPN